MRMRSSEIERVVGVERMGRGAVGANEEGQAGVIDVLSTCILHPTL